MPYYYPTEGKSTSNICIIHGYSLLFCLCSTEIKNDVWHLVFRFDDDKTVSSMFEEIWEENTSGRGVALQLYASDIVPLAIKGLANTSWTDKKKVKLPSFFFPVLVVDVCVHIVAHTVHTFFV